LENVTRTSTVTPSIVTSGYEGIRNKRNFSTTFSDREKAVEDSYFLKKEKDQILNIISATQEMKGKKADITDYMDVLHDNHRAEREAICIDRSAQELNEIFGEQIDPKLVEELVAWKKRT